MEMLTQHIILEYIVSLIRGKPPSLLIIVSLVIILLIFVFLSWRILQLKWQLLEKQKYIEKLENDNTHSLRIIEKLSDHLHHISERKLIFNMSDRMHIRHENIEQASEIIKLDQQATEADSTKEISSCLFTAKARNEKKQFHIVMALQKSYEGRYDQGRAITEELKRWQEDGFLDTNYSAKLVHNELKKLIPDFPLKLAGFRKYFNNKNKLQ